MKRVIKAASGSTSIKVIYCEGMSTQVPMLRSLTVSNSANTKQAVMGCIDDYLNLPYLGLDFNEPDTFTLDELLERIAYKNGEDPDCDYIFLFEVNGQAYIDQVAPEENY